MWKIILLAVAVIVMLLVIVIALRPSDFRITRSAIIGAPVGVVFEQVNDFHRWDAWSPWAKMDPDAKSAFAGPAAGPGATMTWSGNNKVGAGRMTILDSRPDAAIQIKLEFLRPFQATHLAEFAFRPAGDQTEVTWTMSGKNNFVGKAVTLVMNCDKMVGGQFEQGLANLNSATPALAKN
jgi:hypothetical protein